MLLKEKKENNKAKTQTWNVMSVLPWKPEVEGMVSQD